MPLGRYINIYIYTNYIYAHIIIVTIIVVVMIIFYINIILSHNLIIGVVIHIFLSLLLLLLCYRDGSPLGVLWSVMSNQLRPAAKML